MKDIIQQIYKRCVACGHEEFKIVHRDKYTNIIECTKCRIPHWLEIIDNIKICVLVLKNSKTRDFMMGEDFYIKQTNNKCVLKLNGDKEILLQNNLINPTKESILQVLEEARGIILFL